MNGNKEKITVAVGLSGGVDSSVSAALLKEQGFNVVGVFIHFWAEEVKGSVRDNICCSLESQEDARRVCQKLQIPFYTINLKESFKKIVVDNFLNEYNQARTPNPCVRCNQFIKFGEFIKRARLLGAEYVATGHYAEIKKAKNGLLSLQKGADKEKDQSYFLNQLSQAQLEKTLFPVGHLTKDKVRAIAKRFGLPTAGKKESQEICFIADGRLDLFLERNLKFSEGEIKDIETKKVVGSHRGLALYTIGQRRGIGLPGGPWYVCDLDKKKNVLWVGRDEKFLKSQFLQVKQVNWISGIAPKLPLNVDCRIRYRSKDAKVKITKDKGKMLRVEFKRPERAVTPGQYAVFYDKKECLGGGVIV